MKSDLSSTSQMSNTENHLNLHLSTGASTSPDKAERHIKLLELRSWTGHLKRHKPAAPQPADKHLPWSAKRGRKSKVPSNLSTAIISCWCQGWVHNQVAQVWHTHPEHIAAAGSCLEGPAAAEHEPVFNSPLHTLLKSIWLSWVPQKLNSPGHHWNYI